MADLDALYWEENFDTVVVGALASGRIHAKHEGRIISTAEYERLVAEDPDRNDITLVARDTLQ